MKSVFYEQCWKCDCQTFVVMFWLFCAEVRFSQHTRNPEIVLFVAWSKYNFLFFLAFKLAKADMYRQRLKERQRRKKLAREHGLISCATSIGAKKAQTNKKKLSKEDR